MRGPACWKISPTAHATLPFVFCSGMKTLLDEVDTSVLRWKSLLDSVNTAEDTTFAVATEGAYRPDFATSSSPWFGCFPLRFAFGMFSCMQSATFGSLPVIFEMNISSIRLYLVCGRHRMRMMYEMASSWLWLPCFPFLHQSCSAVGCCILSNFAHRCTCFYYKYL